jgi:hypothetical protein
MISASVLLAASLVAGCSNSGPPASAASAGSGPAPVQSASHTTEDAIRTAIQAHLAHKGTLNLSAFQTEVKQVAIQGDRAQAEVEYRVKDGPGSMQLTYALEKRDNAWSVVESVPVGSNFSHPSLDPSQVPVTSGPAAPVSPLSDPTSFFKSATGAKPAPAR